jgi:hypothetical protein
MKRAAHSVLPSRWRLAAAPRGRSRRRRTRPNLILIQAVDLGYGDLSAYGQTHFRTAVARRARRGGDRFTQYYAGSTVCAPSRTALLTGRHTGHACDSRQLELPLREADVTLAMALPDAGYRTAVIGKWGLGQSGTSGEPDEEGVRLLVRLPRSAARASPVTPITCSATATLSDGSRARLRERSLHPRDAVVRRRGDPRAFFVY